MIKYNSNTINDWNFGDDNIIKVYRNNTVCYYKIETSPAPEPQYRTISGETYCSGQTGYDKYVDVYSQVSYDGGSTWETTATTPTLVEADSPDCKQVKNYLRFTSKGSGTFTFYANGADSSNVLSYSLDSGSTWTQLGNGVATPSVSNGDVIMWKGSSHTINSNGIGTFSSTTNFDVAGNAMSLYYGDNFEGEVSLSGKDYAFKNLFSGCTTVIDAENLELPATTLSNNCYQTMFRYAVNLTKVPNALPATALTSHCYDGMYYQCSGVTSIPSHYLSATTLAPACYWAMFQMCSGITSVDFSIPSTDGGTPTLAASACTNMFNRCTGLTTPPTLPATTLQPQCYYNMFYQNLSLTESPVLPAPTLVQDCYRQMFYGSTKLNTVTCLATSGINTNNSTTSWLTNASSTGTFYRASGVSWPTGNNGRKSWTLVNYSG